MYALTEQLKSTKCSNNKKKKNWKDLANYWTSPHTVYTHFFLANYIFNCTTMPILELSQH